jgi:hypothetical protein
MFLRQSKFVGHCVESKLDDDKTLHSPQPIIDLNAASIKRSKGLQILFEKWICFLSEKNFLFEKVSFVKVIINLIKMVERKLNNVRIFCLE